MTPTNLSTILRQLHVTLRSYWGTPSERATIHSHERTEKATKMYDGLILAEGRPLTIQELAVLSGNTSESVSRFFHKHLEKYDVTLDVVDTTRGPRSVRRFWPLERDWGDE